MVKAPTPEEEDRRRLCRERKVLIGERVQHVNRVKGLLFSQWISGYEPLRRDRRERLDTLQTGDGRLLPDNLKAQVRRQGHRAGVRRHPLVGRALPTLRQSTPSRFLCGPSANTLAKRFG